MKHFIYFIFFACMLGCGTGTTEPVALTKTDQRFQDVFALSDSVVLKPRDFNVPVNFAITKDREFLLCDYTNKKVQLLNAGGEFKRDVLRDTVAGKVFGSPLTIAINDDNGYVYVADNSNRRVYILDADYNYKSSFIISGSHMTPVYMQAWGNRLVMSGHNINNNKFIHVYSAVGVYQKSFYKTHSGYGDNTWINGAGNYIKFDRMNNETYSIEMMNYGLAKTDEDMDATTAKNYTAAYFAPITKSKLNSIKNSFEEIKSSIAKPSYLKCVDNKVYVFSELPAGDAVEDYFNTRHYILDIFDRELSSVMNGIDIGNLIPVGFYNAGRSFAFLSHHDAAKGTYTIKFYTLKK